VCADAEAGFGESVACAWAGSIGGFFYCVLDILTKG
jgi:hypothetical protein